MAIGQKQRNDYTVGLKWGIDAEKNLYLLNIIRGQFDSRQITEAIVDLWVSTPGTREVFVEEGALSHAIGPYLNEQISSRRLYGLTVTPVKPGRSDKEARARVAQGMLKDRRVYIPSDAPWLPAFTEELSMFPYGKHDDQVDALAYAARSAADLSAPTVSNAAAVDATTRWMRKLLRKTRFGRPEKSWMTA